LKGEPDVWREFADAFADGWLKFKGWLQRPALLLHLRRAGVCARHVHQRLGADEHAGDAALMCVAGTE